MATEIERKFLVRGDGWRDAAGPGRCLRQGYVCADAGRSVRIRVEAQAASLTLKGATQGVQRDEFEYAIPVDDATLMLKRLCTGAVIEKTRYPVTVAGHVFEVDVFEGANSGLVVAELELAHPDQDYPRPPWLGAEVSALTRYYNAALVDYPYQRWSSDERAGKPA